MMFKDKLKYKMLDEGYSYGDEPSARSLSKAMNGKIHQNTINKYLKGVNRPQTMREYELLAQYLGVSVFYLYYDRIDNERFENQNVGEATGMSDKAIDTLRTMKANNLTPIVNEMIESESFVDYVINRSIKNDVGALLVEVESQYDRVLELQENYENPFEEYTKIDNYIMELGSKYTYMEANLEAYFPFTERHLNFVFEYGEDNKEDFSYKSFEHELFELRKNLQRAMNLIEFNASEYLSDLRKRTSEKSGQKADKNKKAGNKPARNKTTKRGKSGQR